MAITLDHFSGFELGSLLSEFDTVYGNATLSTGAGLMKTGAYSLRIPGSSADGVGRYITASRQKRLSFWVRREGGTYNDIEGRFMALCQADDTEIFRLMVKSSLNRIGMWIGGTQRGAYYTNWPLNSWMHIGIDVKINSTTGWAALYVDGVLTSTYSGNTGNVDIARVILGNADGNRLYGWNFDDYTIWDSTGESSYARVDNLAYYWQPVISASGGETYKQWVGSDGNSVDNYAHLDDLPHNSDTDYVETASTGQKDSYNLQAFTLPAGALLNAVIPTVVARKSGAGDCQIKVGTVLSGSEVASTASNLAASYSKAFYDRQATKPGGGSWTESDVNNSELLIESAGTFS